MNIATIVGVLNLILNIGKTKLINQAINKVCAIVKEWLNKNKQRPNEKEDS